MILSVLICTIDEGIRKVPEILLQERTDVNYVVSFQYTNDLFLKSIPENLTKRVDVSIYRLSGKGLSRNRNNALKYATGDIVLIADDDVRYRDEYFTTILNTFENYDEVDIALFKAKDHAGKWMKKYPSYSYNYMNSPKGTYPSSLEIVMRGNVFSKGVRFNEQFGLGADFLACGEESILLYDALKKKLNIYYFPEVIVETNSYTTGMKLLSDKKVQRSKGAVFYYCYGYWNALCRCTKESLYHFIHSFTNPFVLLKNMYDGIEYCRKTKGEK